MNIALIAMSGIRVCDAELLRMGLTLPGFVERSKTIASLPSLGLLTLAGMTDPCHELHYLEVPDLNALDEVPQGFDLVAISSYSAQIGEAYALARKYKETGVPVVLGGPHVTALPQEALLHGSAVAVGAGEASWDRIVRDGVVGRLEGLYEPETDDGLDAAPLPAFGLLDIAKYNRLTVQTSRGCPHRCEFCASSVMLTDTYQQKPVARVLGEIDAILEIWKQPFIEFADDNSFVNKAYWKELLPELEKRGIRWFTETDMSVAEDDALLDLMRRSGCAQVLIGFESPTRPALAGMELHNDWKFKHHDQARQAIRNIQAHGITVNGCFIVGLDQHGPEIFDQVFDFVDDSGLYEVQVTLLTPFPGTPLYARLEREQRLLYPGAWERCTLFDVNYIPAGMDAPQLAEGFRRLVERLYGEEFTQHRRERFRRQLRKRKTGGGAS